MGGWYVPQGIFAEFALLDNEVLLVKDLATLTDQQISRNLHLRRNLRENWRGERDVLLLKKIARSYALKKTEFSIIFFFQTLTDSNWSNAFPNNLIWKSFCPSKYLCFHVASCLGEFQILWTEFRKKTPIGNSLPRPVRCALKPSVECYITCSYHYSRLSYVETNFLKWQTSPPTLTKVGRLHLAMEWQLASKAS